MESVLTKSEVRSQLIHGAIRRTISISSVICAFVLTVVLLPIAIPLAVAYDLVGRGKRTAARAYLFFLSFFTLELVGIVAAFGLWLMRCLRALSEDAYMDAHRRLQAWWAATLSNSAIGLFNLQLDVDNRYEFGRRPFVLFVRHVSFADTVLPMICAAIPKQLRIRYVLKRELLWDPCLDIVGQRLPNVFVAREPESGNADRALIRALGGDLANDEGIVIFPEGTRFTGAKRQLLIERSIAKKRTAIADEAQALTHVLPARSGGMLAALAGDGARDAVFCAHTGLENATRFADLVNGKLRGSRVAVTIWSVDAEAIPDSSSAKCQWFSEQWRRVDEWIAHEQEPPSK